VRDLLAEDLGFEGLNRGVGIAPRGFWQPGLPASLAQEGLPVPHVLGCDLGEKQAAKPSALDIETVAANFNILRAMDLPERREDRNLDGNSAQFLGTNWLEASILQSRTQSTVLDNLVEFSVRVNLPNTSSQIISFVERDESALKCRQLLAGGPMFLDKALGIIFFEGGASQLQQLSPGSCV